MPFNIAFAARSTFESRFFSGAQLVGSGASGDIVTLTPPQGQRVKLETLTPVAGQESGLSVSIGGVNVITSLVLSAAGTSTVGLFAIGRSGTLCAPSMPGSTKGITGGIGDQLKIIKDTGSTSNDIGYSYHFGV